MTKKAMFFILYILFISNLYSYEKLTDWRKNEINGNELFFDGKFFILDRKEIKKNELSFISFNLENKNKIEADEAFYKLTPSELLSRAKILEEKHKDASLLVLFDEGIQKLNKDGTRYSRSRYSVKIMNDKELSQAALNFYFSKGQHETNIIMARSISPDGKTSYLSKEDIKFTGIKEKGLSFFSGRKDEYLINAVIPNVKTGSIIDYEFETTEESPEDKNQFFPAWYFGGDKPVFESRIEIIIPQDKELFWTTRNISSWKNKPSVTEKEGYKTYIFEYGQSEPPAEEPYSRPKGEFHPVIFASLFKNQTYLSNWFSKFMKERMIPNDKMKETVLKLIEKENAKTEEEKISVLYRFMQEYIHYRSIKTSLSSGFSGHPAAETFENRYGDCIDKSILFSTLLSVINIESYPVIVMTNDKPKALYNEIGYIYGNHAITEVHLKEKEKKVIYLDSTSLTYRYPVFRYDDQGILAWNPVLNTVKFIEVIDPLWNTQIFKKEIEINQNGNGLVKINSIYSGDNEAGLRNYFLSLKKEEIKALVYSIIARDFHESTLKDYSFSDPLDFKNNFILNYNFEVQNLFKKTGSYYVFETPVRFSTDYISLPERKKDLFFQTTEGKKNIITINIPEVFRVLGLPEQIKIENKYFSYTAGYELKNNQITFQDHFIRSGCNIPAAEYPLFREEILKVEHFLKSPLIFEKK